jgi:hypothetical protein
MRDRDRLATSLATRIGGGGSRLLASLHTETRPERQLAPFSAARSVLYLPRHGAVWLLVVAREQKR